MNCLKAIPFMERNVIYRIILWTKGIKTYHFADLFQIIVTN